MTPADLPQRIAAKLSIDPETGCWLWHGYVNRDGYSHLRWEGKSVRGHRLAYHLLVDPTLNGPLDHTCRVRACLNPAHLQPVTQRENVLRGLRGVLGEHTSRFVGVCRHRQKWQAVICTPQGRRHLGCFASEADAARAFDDAALELFGERTNERLGLLNETTRSTPDGMERAVGSDALRGSELSEGGQSMARTT